MTPFEMGQATVRFALMIRGEALALQGQECEGEHLYLSYCPCEDCAREVQEGYFPGIVCTLCGEPFDEIPEDGDDDEV